MRKTIREIQALIPVCYYGIDVGIGSTKDNIEYFNINLNPEYQRGLYLD